MVSSIHRDSVGACDFSADYPGELSPDPLQSGAWEGRALPSKLSDRDSADLAIANRVAARKSAELARLRQRAAQLEDEHRVAEVALESLSIRMRMVYFVLPQDEIRPDGTIIRASRSAQ